MESLTMCNPEDLHIPKDREVWEFEASNFLHNVDFQPFIAYVNQAKAHSYWRLLAGYHIQYTC